MKKIEILGLQTIPEIKQNDNLSEIIVKSADDESGEPTRVWGAKCSFYYSTIGGKDSESGTGTEKEVQ